jgi:CheY-like chemotaxis protein
MQMQDPSSLTGLKSAPLRLLNGGRRTALAFGEAPGDHPSLRLVPDRDAPVVLIADASEEVLTMLSLVLGRDYDLLRATDGEDALSLALTECPDLIVLDVRMPKLDGYRVTAQIRSNPATADTPVILLDTHPERIDILRGFAAGANDYVTKPFDPITLLRRIQEALESSQLVC